MADDTYSAQIIKDSLARMKDPKNGVKLSTKILDPKKKKKLVYVPGTTLVEWLIKDLGKPDVIPFAQCLLNRQLITKADGRDPRKFSEEDSYTFNDQAAEALEIEALLKNSDSKTLQGAVQIMANGIELKEKKHRLRKFKNAFSGAEAVTWLHENFRMDRKEDAIILGQHLQNKNLIINLLSKTEAFNEKAIYKFTGDGHAEDEVVEEETASGSSTPTSQTPTPPPGSSPSDQPKWEASQLRGQHSTTSLPSPGRGAARAHQPPLLRTRSNKTNDNPDVTEPPASPHSSSPRSAAIPIQSQIRSASQTSIPSSPTASSLPRGGSGVLVGSPGRGPPVAPRRLPPSASNSAPITQNDNQTAGTPPTTSFVRPTAAPSDKPLHRSESREFLSSQRQQNLQNSGNYPLSSSSPSLSPLSSFNSLPTPSLPSNTPPSSSLAAPSSPVTAPPPRPTRQAVVKVVNRESRLGGGNTEENLWVQTDTKDEKILIKQQLVSAEQAFIQSVSVGKSNYIENNPSLSEFEKEILFANLQEIIDSYKSVINQNLNSEASAGDLLLQLVPFLNLFLIYCSNLPNSFSLLSKLRERGNFVEVVVEDSFDIPTFEDLLEFPKFHLDDYSTLILNFIERLNLESEHAGEVRKLTQALQQFESIQHKVKRRDLIPKHLVRTWDIEHSFPDHENFQLEGKELLKEGTVRLVKDSKGPVGNDTLNIFIFRGVVIVAQPINGYSLRSLIHTAPECLTVRDLGAECKNSIEFTCNGRVIVVSVNSSFEKRRWLDHLPVKYDEDRTPIRKVEF